MDLANEARHAEVTQLELRNQFAVVVDVDENVFRFQITVQNTLLMAKNNRLHNLLEHIAYHALSKFVVVHIHIP